MARTHTPRYMVQTMCWPNPNYAVWDRAQNREIEYLSTDRKKIARRVDELNTLECQTAICEVCEEDAPRTETDRNWQQWGVSCCDDCVVGGLDCGALPLGLVVS